MRGFLLYSLYLMVQQMTSLLALYRRLSLVNDLAAKDLSKNSSIVEEIRRHTNDCLFLVSCDDTMFFLA